MKRLFSIVILGIVLMGCKAWDASLMEPADDPIDPKLPALEKSITDYSTGQVETSDDEMRIFTKEVENNLTDPYGDKYGYIALSSSVIDYGQNWGFTIINALGMYLPVLVGVPMAIAQLEMDVTVRVLDADRNLIGKYNAKGEASTPIALYYGYKMMKAGRKTHADCLNAALTKIRSKIEDDANRLNKELKKAGPM